MDYLYNPNPTNDTPHSQKTAWSQLHNHSLHKQELKLCDKVETQSMQQSQQRQH